MNREARIMWKHFRGWVWQQEIRSIIWKNHEINFTELHKKCKGSRANIATQLKWLLEQDHIEKIQDSKDSRIKLYRLTDLGKIAVELDSIILDTFSKLNVLRRNIDIA